MDRNIAEAICKEFRALSEPFNRITELSMQLPKDEARAVRRPLGEWYLTLCSELICPIYAQYPDLNPDSQGPQAEARAHLAD